MTMTVSPSEKSISFEYHYFVVLAGLIAALIWRKTDPKLVLKHYKWV